MKRAFAALPRRYLAIPATIVALYVLVSYAGIAGNLDPGRT